MLHTQTRCRSVHVRGVPTGQKTVENQDWAAGSSRAVSRGPACSKTRTLRPIVPFHVYRNVNLSLSFNILIYRDGRVLDTVCQHSRDL